MNKYSKQLIILPEDCAYLDIANGFLNHPQTVERVTRIDTPAGGWRKLKNCFDRKYVKILQRCQDCHLLMLLDLDGDLKRHEEMLDRIPDDLKDRVFVLSGRNEAERIKSELRPGSFEATGEMLAASCYEGTHADPAGPWSRLQLKHNQAELKRLARKVCPFLFKNSPQN